MAGTAHANKVRDLLPHGQQPQKNLHRQAELDGGIAVVGLPPALAGGRGLPAHRGVEPDRQRAPALECGAVGGPVPGLVGRRCGSAHAERLPPRTHEMNPLRGFVQHLWAP